MIKAFILAGIVSIGVGLASPAAMAAPANGNVVGQAAAEASPVTKVWCGWRRVCGPRGCGRRWVCW